MAAEEAEHELAEYHLVALVQVHASLVGETPKATLPKAV
jgi:hypothetical protein